MKKKVIKIICYSVIFLLTAGVLIADPVISQVTVRQRWPWSRLVDIDYMLSCELTQSVDIVIQAYSGTTPLTLPENSFSGDMYSVSYGIRHIVWDPTVTAYTNNGALPNFSIDLSPIPVPLYMIVDLTRSAGEEGQIEYVYESDLRAGVWGSWCENPVTNAGNVIESVIWTGVTTNDIYKTDKLVLRRIHAGTFGMGDSANISTTLTKDFYAGVFEVTQAQWELITGAKPSYFNNATYYSTRPLEYRSYNDIRGATDSNPAVNWPLTGREIVLPSSFIGLLRTQTGIEDFDLPTEAQWECLCRAETTTVFHDGDATANVSGANAYTNEWLEVLGRYRYNGGFIDGATSPSRDCTPANGTAVVGSFQPNAWGLYDTHGNVWEWCLDWFDTLQGGEDPTGTSTGTSRLRRGGDWYSSATSNRSATRDAKEPSYASPSVGFRLVRTLP